MKNPPSASIIEDLEDLYENAPCGYLSLDPGGRIFKVNKTLCNWVGYAPEHLLGKRLGDLLNIAGRMFYETHIAPLLRMQGFFNEVALDLVLSNPGVKSLVVNFCGAFARTDVMAEGVVLAWESLKPKIPAFFSIHGTGEDEAVKLVRERLGIEPYDFMEDAVKAAVEAAK